MKNLQMHEHKSSTASENFGCPIFEISKGQQRHKTCPYLQNPNSSGGTCGISGVYHDGYNFEHYCLSSSNWLKCANYEGQNK